MKNFIEIDISENNSLIKAYELPKNFQNTYDTFEEKSKLFQLFSDIVYYGIAYPILSALLKIIYDLKIEGKENIQQLKAGAVTVSNHVLVLDCAMVGIACGMKKVCFTTQEESFEIPFVRKLIKVLNAIPIPKGLKNKKIFIEEVNKRLQAKKIVHFYPEGSLVPYCSDIRNFKNGCFDFAVRNHVPIIPMVFIFRKPKGIRKFLKKKKDVTLQIGEPIFASEEGKMNEKIENLKNNTYQKMKEIVREKKE